MAAADYSKNGGEIVLAPHAAMCLDFANTLAYRGSSPIESLHTFSDLLKWCGETAVIPRPLAHQLKAWPEKHPKRSAEVFSEAIALREAIYRVFHAVASGASTNQADLDLLNRSLQEAPPRTTILQSAGRFGWRIEESKPTASSILTPVLWSAGDLLVGPQLAKLRECLNDKCLWLFLDDSKNGTRRWCSMQACGNRAKAHRHYLRQKRG
jgi:predicted RNA-binding Zn ribbon-like protein